MKEQYNSSDIWLVSYLLCETNAKLTDVLNNNSSIQFCIQGENLQRLAKSYIKSEALANVIELRSKINYLRDIIFESRRQRKIER